MLLLYYLYLCTVEKTYLQVHFFIKIKAMTTKKESTLVSRPRRKADSSVKGKLNRWSDSDYVEFVPTGTRESNRRMLKQLGNSSFYKSEGQKESSYSLHLNVDGESSDPVGEMFQQFLVLTQGEQKQKPQMPESCWGQMLMDDGSVKIWLDSERGKLTILTELECTPKIERMLLQAQSKMNVVVGRYRGEIMNNNNQ